MENFSDHSFEPKENLFGREYLEVKYHEFTLEEAEWYLGERPYDELDGQIGNAVIALKSFIRNGEIEVPEVLDSNQAFEAESELRKLLEEEEPGIYFKGTDSPLSIRISAMHNALEPQGNNIGDEVYGKLWNLLKKRYGLSQEGSNENEFIMLIIQNLGLADDEFKTFGSPTSKLNLMLGGKKKTDEGQE